MKEENVQGNETRKKSDWRPSAHEIQIKQLEDSHVGVQSVLKPHRSRLPVQLQLPHKVGAHVEKVEEKKYNIVIADLKVDGGEFDDEDQTLIIKIGTVFDIAQTLLSYATIIFEKDPFTNHEACQYKPVDAISKKVTSYYSLFNTS